MTEKKILPQNQKKSNLKGHSPPWVKVAICVFCSAIFLVTFDPNKDIFQEKKVLGSDPKFRVLAQTLFYVYV